MVEQEQSNVPLVSCTHRCIRPRMGTTMRGTWRFIALAGLWAGLGCADNADKTTPSSAGQSSLAEVVTWGPDIRLEENSEVINVAPAVNMDSTGRFLVADSREAQVRVYSPQGELLYRFGSKGYGPGELQHPTAAFRTSSGAIAVTDMDGKIVVFDSVGSSLARTVRTPLGPLYDASPVNDSLVLLIGRLGAQISTPLLHLWNIRSDSLVRSFFPAPELKQELRGASAFMGTADAAVRGDTVASVFALTDTLYLFRLNGQQIGKIPIPFSHARLLETPLPTNGSPEKMQQWRESFSSITNIFWQRDGSFLIQYYDTEGAELRWRLLKMKRNGDLVFDVRDAPRLLASSDTILYFVKPGSLTPNLWSSAYLTPSP